MLKKIIFLSLSTIIILSSCELRTKDPEPIIEESQVDVSGNTSETALITSEEGQELFSSAFKNAQEPTEESDQGQISLAIVLTVEDNENDVLPEALESMKGNIAADWDFAEITDLQAKMSAELYFNQSTAPDFSFSAVLNKNIVSYILNAFNEKTVNFLGLAELLGGEQGIKDIQNQYLDSEGKLQLNDDQVMEIANSFKNANKDSGIIINTTEEESKIIDSFLSNKVIKITEGIYENDIHTLNFVTRGKPIVDFLNEVAKINNLERDFSNDLQNFSKMDISGTIEIKEEMITAFNCEIYANKSLIENAEKDIIIGVEFISNGEDAGTWKFSLSDSIENVQQASLQIGYQKDLLE